MIDFIPEVGKKVYIRNRASGERIDIIAHVTPTGQFYTKTGYKFDAHGDLIGSDAYDDTLVRLPMVEDYKRISNNNRRRFVRDFEWAKLTDAQITNIWAMIQEYIEINEATNDDE